MTDDECAGKPRSKPVKPGRPQRSNTMNWWVILKLVPVTTLFTGVAIIWIREAYGYTVSQEVCASQLTRIYPILGNNILTAPLFIAWFLIGILGTMGQIWDHYSPSER